MIEPIARCGCLVSSTFHKTDGYKITCPRHKISWNIKDIKIQELKDHISMATRIFEYLVKYDADLIEMAPNVSEWLAKNKSII